MNKAILRTLIFFAAIWPVTSSAQQADEVNETQLETRAEYLGFLECARCHVHPAEPDLDGNVTDFVNLTEYHTWLNDDPHSRAYLSIIPDKETFDRVRAKFSSITQRANPPDANGRARAPLNIPSWNESSNQRSMEILTSVCGVETREVADFFRSMTDLSMPTDRKTNQQRYVRFDDPKLAGYSTKLISTTKQCMSCHAGWDNQDEKIHREVVAYGTGVACEACHGASSEWYEPHKEPAWRLKSPHEKFADFGMYNTRQPIAKSKQCFSCHIGDVASGKVVTHAMYAAGHPPLPSIEIESYSDQIPRHWRYLNEKANEFVNADGFKNEFALDLGMHDASQIDVDFPKTKNVLISGIMASAESAELLADTAGEYLKNKDRAGMSIDGSHVWPEFAAFDCAACHHDLRSGDWDRGFAGVPGRPPAPYWPRSLSRLGLAFAENDLTEFNQKQAAFQDALNLQPFGKPTLLRDSGTAYSQYLQTVAQKIQRRPLTRDDAVNVLSMLCGSDSDSTFDPEDEIWDFHSARQLAWAIRTVYMEVTHTKAEGVMRLSDRLQATDPDVAAILQEMKEYLMLELAPIGEITPLQASFLNSWRDFDRSEFTRMMRQLAESIEPAELTSR